MRNILIVARREYLAYVTAWGFWLGLLLTPLGLVVGVVLPQVIAHSQPVRYYSVLDDRPDFAAALGQALETRRAEEARAELAGALSRSDEASRNAALAAFATARAQGKPTEEALAAAHAPAKVKAPDRRYFEAPPPARAPEQLAPWLEGKAKLDGPDGAKPLFAAFVVRRAPDGAIAGVDYWSKDVVSPDLQAVAARALRETARTSFLRGAGVDPEALKQAELKTPEIVEKRVGAGAAREVSLADRAPYFVAAGIAFVLWLVVFSIVNFLISGTIEERSNKIFDSLLTSVRLSELLAGKLLGVLALCLTLMGTWFLLAGALMLRGADPATVQVILSALKPQLVISGVVGFFAGYAIYAAVFLALGSLCDTIQEAQALLSPLFVVLMIPLFMVVVAIRSPGSPIVEALSWFPPFTPFLMVLRAPLEPPIWQTALQAAMMIATAVLALWGAIRVYRAGAVNGATVAQLVATLNKPAPTPGR